MPRKIRVSFAEKSARLSFPRIFVMEMFCSLLGSCGHQLNIAGEIGFSTGADGVGVQKATELPHLTYSAKGFRTELAFLNLSSESRARFGVQSQQRLQVYQIGGSLAHDPKGNGSCIGWTLPELDAGNYLVRVSAEDGNRVAWQSEPFALERGLTGTGPLEPGQQGPTYFAWLQCIDPAVNSSVVSFSYSFTSISVALWLEGVAQNDG